MGAVNVDSESSNSGTDRPADEVTDFVAERTTTIHLEDGTPIVVRPATSADRPHLIEAFARLSPESVYARFLRPMPVLSEKELAYLSAVDQTDHFAWAAFDEDGNGIGVARYIRDPERPSYAEAAVTVVDDFQRRGIGSALMQLLAESALANGVDHFVAYVGNENTPVLEALARAGAVPRQSDDYATTFEVGLPVDVAFEESALRAALRAAANPHHG